MTGYGKAEIHYNGKKIIAEIKSLNSKALALNTRIIPLYREHEMDIRRRIAAVLERGKVDFNLWTEADAEAAAPRLNGAVVADYIQQIRQLSDAQGLPFPADHIWDIVARMPETLQATANDELTDEEWQAAATAVDQAIERLMAFRSQEGEALSHKFAANLDHIEALLHDIEPYETQRVEKIRARLEERLEELKGVDYDRNRLEQELIYYIEKLDINEEKQRLANHLKYFRETMANGKGQGKKLGFIAQEMGREINTTGSKSNLAEMQNIVVRMKDELEQIKEQVLNVM